MNEVKTESELQKSVFDYLHAKCIFAWRMPLGPVIHSIGGKRVYARNPLKGFPDIAGLFKGRFFAIELKKNKSIKPELHQLKWLQDLKANGAHVAVITSIAELEAFFEKIS